MENLTFEKGEVRKFEYSVRTTPVNDSIVVTAASWKLIDSNGDMVNNGDCDVSGTIISMLITLQSAGFFTLEVTAMIPPETIIDRILLKVVE